MKYFLGANADQDLDEIWEYIAQDSPGSADRWVDKLFQAFEDLANTPGMGHTRSDLTHLDILFWPVGSYVVLYRTTKNMVEIVAITEGSRDIPAFLRRRGNRA